jgi:hypothetical protein
MKKFVTIVVLCFVLAFVMSASACSKPTYESVKEANSSYIVPVGTSTMEKLVKEEAHINIYDSFMYGRTGEYALVCDTEDGVKVYTVEVDSNEVEHFFYTGEYPDEFHTIKYSCGTDAKGKVYIRAWLTIMEEYKDIYYNQHN